VNSWPAALLLPYGIIPAASCIELHATTMSIPSTSIYVRPGLASYTWTYSGATSDSGAIVTAVAFDTVSADGQQVARGDFQYSLDGGRTWLGYVVPADQPGTWLPTGTLWRFVDRTAGDSVTPGSFTVQLKLADGSVVAAPGALVMDNQPVGLLDDRDTVLSTLQAGATVAHLNPIDTGAVGGGRWVIDSQSQPGLFAVGAAGADGSGTLVLANPGALPAPDQGVSVTMHYYDRYQLDASGNPLPNTGVTDILTYTVASGATQDLAGFGADFRLGAASAGVQGQPALATLSGGGFVTVWQAQDPSGAGVFAQLRDAAGAALGATFAVAAGAAIEGEPAVAALPGGRFVVAYSVSDSAASHVAYRIVEADGHVGSEFTAGSAGADVAMPAVAALADGSFLLAWRSGGAVHTLQASGASGAPLGAEHVAGALGSAFNPGVAALHDGSYVLTWGEIADGNVYAAVGASGQPVAVTLDGAAASIQTAAPLPHVASLAGGGFVVAWDSYSNDMRGYSISDIFFQRYDNAGNKVGDLVQANIDSGSGRYDASVASLSDGGFVVTWQGADFDGTGVFGRRFGADGGAIDLREFEVNQLRQGDQAAPAVTGLANGGFVTAWVDTQAGAGPAVEARVLGGGIDTPQPSTTSSSGTGAAMASASTAPSQPVTQVAGTAGSDSIALGTGSHVVDGQGGVDTVLLSGARASFTVAHDANAFTLTAGGAHDTLVNVERVAFADGALALDIDGVAGQAYRLYQAAFDRQPDQVGLGYWIDVMDRGATLEQVAGGFQGSREFADLYGANPTNTQFVDLLYQNVLHRAPDAAGYDYWVDALANQHLARTQMLGFFSESAENQLQVIGSIGNGIAFVPFG
jgi:hypothetical protein